MDRPRSAHGRAARALLGAARDLLRVGVALGAVGALLVVLTWIGVRHLERSARDEPVPMAARRVAARAAATVRGPSAEPWAEEIAYSSRGARLAARLYRPLGTGPHPALVIAHGSGRSLRGQYEELAGGLAARGYALLVYDKRGVGDSEGTYTDVGPGNATAMFDLLADDVLAAVDYLSRRADIDAERIGVLGISQGGWIGPLAASKSRSVSFLVIVSGPAVSVGEEIYYSELTGEREDGSQLRSDDELGAQLATFTGPHGFDPVPVLSRLEAPSLWILGDRDRSIPIPQTVERLESLIAAGRPFTLRVLPGVGHGMRELATGRPVPVVSIAADWLAALRPRPEA